MLRRGTTVTVNAKCLFALPDQVGKTLAELDEAMLGLCGSTTGGPGCLTVEEQPVVEPDLRSTCTVASLTYSPEPTLVAGQPPALEQGTLATVTTVCPGPAG